MCGMLHLGGCAGCYNDVRDATRMCGMLYMGGWAGCYKNVRDATRMCGGPQRTKAIEDLAKVGCRSGDINLRDQVVTVILEMATLV